jgi:hypothetical protein
MLVAPPIGTTKTPSPRRSRPWRAARVSRAAWSLIPSTRTIAQEPGTARARAAAAASAALLPDGGYKLAGDLRGALWWAIKLCRFEPGELDPYVDGLRRLPADARILP